MLKNIDVIIRMKERDVYVISIGAWCDGKKGKEYI